MPRYRVLNVNFHQNNRFNQRGDTAQTVLSRIAEQINRGNFVAPPNKVDVDNEAEAIDIISVWAMSPGTRIVVEYEPVSNDTIRLLGFRNTTSFDDYFYRYNQPLLLNTRTRSHEPLMAEATPLGIAVIRPVANQINPEQSTHETSVHTSVAESLSRLNHRYSNQINVEHNINQLQQFSKEITVENYPETTKTEREAAQRFIARMPSLFDQKESKTALSIKYILALLVEAINDEENRTVDKKMAQQKLIQHFYEIQRGYNLDSHGKDNQVHEDNPICVGGTINKLVDALNGGFHRDVEILFVTKETATYKFSLLVQNAVIHYIKESENKVQLMKELEEGKTDNNENSCYSIPDSILEQIKEKAKQEFFDEFSGFIANNELEEIFNQYEYISLTKEQFAEVAKFKDLANQEPNAPISIKQNDSLTNVETSLINPAVKKNTIEILTEQKKLYEERVTNQWGSSMRAGAKKNLLIQKALNAAIEHIEKDDLSTAQSIVSNLKKELESHFGKNNFWGKTSESYKLVTSVEQQLRSVNTSNNSNFFKEELTKIKEDQEEQNTPNYHNNSQ